MSAEGDLAERLRVLLRDGGGELWQDEELISYLQISLWVWNAWPPETDEGFGQLRATWRAPILWGGVVQALKALQFVWVKEAEGFRVTDNVLLSAEVAAKYMELLENAEDQFNRCVKAKSKIPPVLAGLGR